MVEHTSPEMNKLVNITNDSDTARSDHVGADISIQPRR
jgi:hypothetical protein